MGHTLGGRVPERVHTITGHCSLSLLFSLLSVLSLAWCHDLRYLEADLTSVTSSLLPHIVTSHLASLLYTTIPALLAASLCFILSRLASANTYFLLTALLPLVPIVAGACFMTH